MIKTLGRWKSLAYCNTSRYQGRNWPRILHACVDVNIYVQLFSSPCGSCHSLLICYILVFRLLGEPLSSSVAWFWLGRGRVSIGGIKGLCPAP